MNNPLLQKEGLPAFESIQASHIEPAIDHLLSKNRRTIESLLNTKKDYNWNNLLQKIEDMDDRLNRAWSPASHLHSVADNEQLREAYNACLSKLSDYSTEMGQNEGLFHAYETIANNDDYESLNTAQQKIIKNALRDFRLSGIDLDDKAKERYKIIQQKLSILQTKFEENLLDATHAWKKLITNRDELSGLPESAIALAAQTAKSEDKQGWLFTLDFPSYMPVMQYADNAGLRKEFYHAYVTRASNVDDDWDNSKVMLDILKYRTEKAKLLGFESYAHYSLTTKMANNPKEVMDFLNDLAERTQEYAKQEYEELKQFALEMSGETANITQLEAWDVAYYSEKLRQKKFDISQEILRPYFPVNQVIEGLFAITNKLYGVTIKQRKGIQVWHKDVMFFDIFDAQEKIRGSFYLDLYARQHKRGGAWMDECIVRKKSKAIVQDPVAYLTCNFTPPIGDKAALLTHDEVTTLFHEFGHGLHHMMTRVDYSGVSGINGVPWDAVELPSQFMENWCWEKEALDLFARHIDTGKVLDDDLFEKMTRARTFQAGMQMVRQLEFSLFDFRLHLEFASNESLNIQDLLNEVRQQVAVVKTPEFNRFQHSFSHIFAGGYAAGYYSYKWAEVLSADAFSKFEEKGIFDKTTGNEFLQAILEQGGSREPMDLFVEFRGRKPSIEPLLRHSGITV
jgi:oligopeptidase A